MKFKKLLCLGLAAAAALTIVSCGNDKDKKKSNYKLSEDDLSYLSHIEQEDMGGYNFRILTRKNHLKKQVVEEETGETVEDAIYRRNETVKSMFNIEITGVEDDSDHGDDALNAILGGDDQYDIILPHSRTAFSYAIQNTLVNLRDVKTLALDKEWWYKDVIDTCDINGYLYVVDGDISTDGLDKAATMFFNKRIFDDLGLPYPYQMVLDNEWTFDAFSKLVKQGTKDLNGDGIIKEADDQYGYSTRDWYGPMFVLYSGGQRIYGKDSRNLPRLTLNSGKTVQIFSKFFELANSEDVFLQLDGKRMPTEDIFKAGRAMFADGDLGAAKTMRNMNDDFGILPFPKFSAEDKEYSTLVNGAASLLCMPTTVEDYDRTGKIVEALGAIGNRDVIPAYYEVSLKTKFSRDAESEQMIDIIKDTLTYDLGYLSGSPVQSVGCDLSRQSNPDFAAYYASNESKAISQLNDFIATYGKIG